MQYRQATHAQDALHIGHIHMRVVAHKGRVPIVVLLVQEGYMHKLITCLWHRLVTSCWHRLVQVYNGKYHSDIVTVASSFHSYFWVT
jgi:hypothetical protein